MSYNCFLHNFIINNAYSLTWFIDFSMTSRVLSISNLHIHTFQNRMVSSFDDICTNVLGSEFMVDVLEAYYPYDHKPMYIASKLPNNLPLFNKQQQNLCFYLSTQICRIYIMHFILCTRSELHHSPHQLVV